MEGKSKSELNLSISDWKLKQETLRNQRNFRQLENRLVILEMERQAKVKSIERKLENHKKMMEVRMDRFRLKQELQKHDKSINEETGCNSRVFRDVRSNRASNIRAKSTQFRDTNHRLFRQIKKQREENENYIKQQNQKEMFLKMQKRNKVRLIQIECKENINKFWRHRLHQLKESRENEMLSRLEQEQKKMQWLLNLQKSEEQLLQEIKKTEEMESQLMSMMEQEKSIVSTTIAASKGQQ